eukprot:scaffold1053_cov107-Isochrysis_galbana.AAC.15
MSPHFGQKVLHVCVRGMSDCPTGRTACPWQNTRGQRPKWMFLYLPSMPDMPRGVMMYRAWIRPYKSSAAASTASCGSGPECRRPGSKRGAGGPACTTGRAIGPGHAVGQWAFFQYCHVPCSASHRSPAHSQALWPTPPAVAR